MKQIPEDEKLTKASSLDEDVQISWNELDSVTISTQQLCKKLRKFNQSFKYEFINEKEEASPEHSPEDLSPSKKQTLFIENMMSDIIAY